MGKRRLTGRITAPRFQGIIAPIGIAMPKAIMKGVNAKLKNGGPTLSFRSNIISANSGQIVPTNTTKAETANNILFNTNAVSRLTMENAPRACIADARAANKVKAPPMKIAKMIRINTPRSGSFAKACTDVKTPDRTINVPIKENPKARMARRMVQLFKLSRFSTTIAECNKAAARSHGIKEAFSTGSQNQKPPQPNS